MAGVGHPDARLEVQVLPPAHVRDPAAARVVHHDVVGLGRARHGGGPVPLQHAQVVGGGAGGGRARGRRQSHSGAAHGGRVAGCCRPHVVLLLPRAIRLSRRAFPPPRATAACEPAPLPPPPSAPFALSTFRAHHSPRLAPPASRPYHHHPSQLVWPRRRRHHRWRSPRAPGCGTTYLWAARSRPAPARLT